MINKNELKKKYKESETPMGVYQIKNMVNGKIFIGSHINVNGRINRHKFELDCGSEGVTELLNDYNKYGVENFTFEVIDILKPKDEPGYNYKEDLQTLEDLWKDKLQPYGINGYNIKEEENKKKQ